MGDFSFDCCIWATFLGYLLNNLPVWRVLNFKLKENVGVGFGFSTVQKAVDCAFNRSHKLKMLTFLKPYISASISISERSWQFNPIKGNRMVLQCQSAHPSACPFRCHSVRGFIFSTGSSSTLIKPPNTLKLWKQCIFPSICLLLIIEKNHSWSHWLYVFCPEGGIFSKVRNINTHHSVLCQENCPTRV